MRRALRLMLIAALAAALAAAATGWHVHVLLGELETDGEALEALEGTGPLIHAVLGHVTAVLTGLVAAMAFVIGLQGLLDAGGRRALSGLLFILAPTLTWLAFGMEISGGVDVELVERGLLGSELERLFNDHALMGGGGLLLALVATALVAWRLARLQVAENR